MRQAVAAALERLATRIEFNDGFELDLITPETWLAERHARAVIEDWARDDIEIVELRLAADELEASRRLVHALESRVARRALVLHVLDEGYDAVGWQPLFRRLNENRNAIVREFPGNLVLLLPPRLLRGFATEAPDMWSIGSTLVVGTRTQNQLLEAMLQHMHALLRLTRETHEESLARARTVADAWVNTLSDVTTYMRARQLFELLLEYDREQLLAADIPVPIERRSISAFRLALTGGRRLLMPHPVIWTGNPAFKFVPLQVLTDPAQLIDICQVMKSETIRVGLVESISPDDPRLAALRGCVDLVLVSQPSDRWSVILGDARLAAVVELGASEHIVIEFESHRAARVAFRHLNLDTLSPPTEQLWLPGIDPEDLGSAPLYRPQPHH